MSAGTLAAITGAVLQAAGVGVAAGTSGNNGSTPSMGSPLGYAEPREAFAAFNKIPPVQPAFVPSWSVFATGFGGQQTISSAVAGSGDSTNSIYGTIVGASYRMSPDTVFGFALTGGGTKNNAGNGSTGSSDLFQASVFAARNFGATYLTGVFSYGWQGTTSNRQALTEVLRSQYDVNSYTTRIEGGHRYMVSGYGLTPYAAVQVIALDLPAYSENASASGTALNYSALTATETRTELGLRSDRSFVITDAILTLSGRAAWAHDFNANQSITAAFQSLPATSFVMNGAVAAADSALVTTAAAMRFKNGWSVEAAFEGDFSDIVTTVGGRGTLRYDW